MTFCDQCGARLSTPTPDTSAPPDFCPNCGASLTGSAPAPVAPPPAPTPSTTAPDPRWAGRPAGWGSVWHWLNAGMMAHPAGTLAALFAAWFSVPLAVMLGVVGVVAGAIMGFFSGTPLGEDVRDRVWVVFDLILPIPVDIPALIPDEAWQVGAMLGLIIGAVYGGVALAWLGLSGSWRILWEGDPMWPITLAVGNVAAALILGVLYVVFMVLTERWRLGQFGGARRPSGREAAVLGPAVAEAAARLDVASVPVVLVDDREEPEVRAHARHLVVSRGFLAAHVEEPERLTALIGRELIHWRGGHPVTALWVRGVALPLAIVYDVAAALFAPTTNTRARPLMFAFQLLLWPVTVTVQRIMVPLQAGWWRRATIEADRIAADAGWGEYVAEDISTARPNPARVQTWRRAFDATPPVEERLQALEDAGVRRRDLAADLAVWRIPTGRRGGFAVGTQQREEVGADE
jgi:Zn-dependent protease with chaperone function